MEVIAVLEQQLHASSRALYHKATASVSPVASELAFVRLQGNFPIPNFDTVPEDRNGSSSSDYPLGTAVPRAQVQNCFPGEY